MMRVRVLFIVGVLVGWLAIELFAGGVGPSLPDAVVWHNADAQKKIAILESGLDAQQLVTGTSQVMQGVDPSVFDQPTINVALGGAVPEFQELWLLEQVLPRRRVERVVWGVNPLLDFAATDQPPTVLVQYLNAPVIVEPVRWRLEQRLAGVSGIARSRRQFSAYGLFGAFHTDPGDIDGLGMRTDFGQQVTRQQERIWGRRMTSHEYGKREHFVDVVTELRRRDIAVVIVEMPLPDRTVELLPGQFDRYAREQQRLQGLVDELDVELLRPPAHFGANERFVDFTHFSEPANVEFSNWLRDALRASGD